MIRALACLLLAALAGAQGVQQPRSEPTFTFSPDFAGCFRASVGQWKCIGSPRPWWILMPLVEPLPPPRRHRRNAPDPPKHSALLAPNIIDPQYADGQWPQTKTLQFTYPESREPMDVPAIQETSVGDGLLVLPDPNNCVDGWIRNELYGNHCASRRYWTCAQKFRVLLTDEAGKRHCVKFGGTR